MQLASFPIATEFLTTYSIERLGGGVIMWTRVHSEKRKEEEHVTLAVAVVTP